LRNQVYLVCDVFVEKLLSHIDGDRELGELPASQRRSASMSLEYYEYSNTTGNYAII
jgi:hypothetical protein